MSTLTASPVPTPHARLLPGGSSGPFYVPLPRRLAEDLRDSPLSIGIYALIARLYRVTRAPVPLSPGDVRMLDPGVSYGAATRALQRLADSPYVVVARARGRKNAYGPAWGAVRGATVPWDLEAPCLGRPRHVAALRLDQRLLDICLGRLRPHGEHPAIVDRYVAAPLLGLADVGAYALALAGIRAQGDALRRLGLLDEGGRPLPLPEDDSTILAIASQRALAAGDNAGLTPMGWARTAFAAPAGPAASASEALFFLPAGQIGERIARGIAEGIGDPIDPQAPDQSASGRSESLKTVPKPIGAGSHGTIHINRENQTTTAQGKPDGGGGERIAIKSRGTSGERETSEHERAQGEEESESYRQLRAIGVRHSVARQLGAHTGEMVARVIADARTRPGVKDLAGWVVSVLRDLPPDQPPPTPPPRVSDLPILLHPGLTHAERERWYMRFRYAAPADRPAILERFHAEHPL